MGLAFRGIYFPFNYLALRSSNAKGRCTYFLYGSKEHLLLMSIFAALSTENIFVSFKGFLP